MLMLMIVMKCQGAFTMWIILPGGMSSDCVNDDDVLRPVHTVGDGELSAGDVKDVCEVGCEVVGGDNVDDNLGRVHTVDVMTDECVDESDGLDGRMNDYIK